MPNVTPHPPPIRKAKCRTHAGFYVVICLIGILLAISVIVNFGLLAYSAGRPAPMLVQRGGEDEFPQLTERWSYGHGDAKAVRISLNGVIMRRQQTGFLGGEVDKIRALKHQIRAATNDRHVRAIILEVDSPGGGVTPSDELYEALVRFKKSRNDRTVVVFMKDIAASGGYYVAVAGDWIVAEPTTIVGSIGVIMQTLNWQELSQKVGIRDTTIKSGKNKDLLNPFHEPSEEQMGLLQEMIDSMHRRFMQLVHESRGIPMDELKEIADGRILDSQAARERNLIDEIGYWEDVVSRVSELLGVKSVKVVRYERPTDLFSLLTQARAPVDLHSLFQFEIPQPLYLWRP